MENMIPLNGRIAIVDDQIEQALPLMRVFAKNNIPYVFYKGTAPEFLPERPENDIRILFLDLNLLDGRDYQPKDIRSTLFATISHIISPNNYPYLLILWSRQEKEYRGILEDLFAEELRQCAPIAILNWIKSDFFPNFTDTNENKENEYIILDELKKTLSTLPAYSYLMQWENCIHNSADETIQNIFHESHSLDNWDNNVNCTMDMFAKSYLDKHYKGASIEEKAKASLFFLNDVFYDTLESTIENNKIENAVNLEYEVSTEQKNAIPAKINGYLFISKSQTQINQPGCVFTATDDNSECVKCAKEILHNCLKNDDIHSQVRELVGNTKSNEAKKLYGELLDARKSSIYPTLLPCGVVVTPACDYAQKKTRYDRVVMGIIIDSSHRIHIDTKSEAIYVSPVFNDGSNERILVLNFRYFITQNLSNTNRERILYRVRNSILSEIQSKLARHINRQGIMSL